LLDPEEQEEDMSKMRYSDIDRLKHFVSENQNNQLEEDGSGGGGTPRLMRQIRGGSMASTPTGAGSSKGLTPRSTTPRKRQAWEEGDNDSAMAILKSLDEDLTHIARRHLDDFLDNEWFQMRLLLGMV